MSDVSALPAPELAPPATDDALTPPTFDVLPLSPETRACLDKMGYLQPTPVQRAVFEPASRGKDLVVQARTGTGKTTAFGLPIVEHLVRRSQASVQTLVLCPTRELALQVAAEIERLGEGRQVKTTAIYGGASMTKQIEDIRNGAQVVVGTPGRVLDHIKRGTFVPGTVRALVLDEADEMLSMGFERELTAIIDALPKERQTLLFSATLPPNIERMAREKLRQPEFITLSSDAVGALSISHFVYFVLEDKLGALIKVLEVENPESAIIFCNMKVETEVVTAALRRNGYDADWLNGDLPQNEREEVVSRIRSGSLRFLVATDVAARGIDISHLTHVINYDFPDNTESYVHRTGRTGRAGRTGTAISLVAPQSIGSLYFLRLAYNIKPFERFLPSSSELKTRREADLVTHVIESFAAQKARPDDLRLARRLLSHDQAEQIIALLLRDRIGTQPETAEEAAAAARRARNPLPPREPSRSSERSSEGEGGRSFDRGDRGGGRGGERGGGRGGDRGGRGGDRGGRGGFDRGDRGDRPSFGGGDRPAADRGDRPATDRGDRPAADRGDRQATERGERGDRQATERGDRGDRPATDRGDRGDRPAADRGDRPSFGGDRPATERGAERPAADHTTERQASGGGDRPERPAFERPERPERPAFDRGERGGRGRGGRGGEASFERGEGASEQASVPAAGGAEQATAAVSSEPAREPSGGGESRGRGRRERDQRPGRFDRPARGQESSDEGLPSFSVADAGPVSEEPVTPAPSTLPFVEPHPDLTTEIETVEAATPEVTAALDVLGAGSATAPAAPNEAGGRAPRGGAYQGRGRSEATRDEARTEGREPAREPAREPVREAGREPARDLGGEAPRERRRRGSPRVEGAARPGRGEQDDMPVRFTVSDAEPVTTERPRPAELSRPSAPVAERATIERPSDLVNWHPAEEEGDDRPIFHGGSEGRGNQGRGEGRGNEGRGGESRGDRGGSESRGGGENRSGGESRGSEGRGNEGRGGEGRGGEGRASHAGAGGTDGGEGGEVDDQDFAVVFVDVGRREGVRPSDLQRALRDVAGIGRRDTGRIRVRDRHSLVAVRRDLLAQAVERLTGTEIAGRAVRAEQARERTIEGD